MSEAEEKAYVAGERAVLRHMISDCARQLGYDDPLAKASALIVEREQARAALRRICAAHGDNDWPDDLRLVDVIEKHLERRLPAEDE